MAHHHHHHHHLLPLILALILLVQLPSTSHAEETPALFSDPDRFLNGGDQLTYGDITLSLSNDCGLILYKTGSPPVDFNTSTDTPHCILRLNNTGQLRLIPSNEKAGIQTIGKAGTPGNYSLLFVDGKLGIFGPAIWSNGVKDPTASQRSINNAATSDNFLVSPGRANGTANGDVPIANNDEVSAYITSNCTLLVKDDTDGTAIWQSSPATDEPQACFVSLSDVGQLLLQYKKGSELYTQWTGGDYVEGPNLYVTALRFYGGIAIYGLKSYLPEGSSSSSSAAAAAVAAENINMVTA